MQKKQNIVLILVLILGLFSKSCNNASENKVDQYPNIVFILADDMGYGDVGFNNPDSKIPTPHIDKLAREGISFTDGHSPAQICTPSRYSILTGRYYWRNEVYKEIGWEVIQAGREPLIEENRLTLPEMLGQNGYHTACIGKWHLGFQWEAKEGEKEIGHYNDLDYTKKVNGGPVTRGFDYFFGLDTPNGSVSFIENEHFTAIPSEKSPKEISWADKIPPGWTYEKIMPTLTQKVLDYIQERAPKDSAFFLYYALTGPHTPIAPDSAFIGKSEAGRYGDFIYQIDYDVGKIVETLKKQGIYDNTVIIFASDNGSPERDGTNYSGPMKSVLKYDHYPNHPWRGMKADLWEGGHRVPFIIRWHGVTEPNTSSDVTVSLIDIMRTLANYLDIELPGDAAEDSYDIMPALRGEKISGHDPFIIYNSEKPAIRSGKWKLILDAGPTGFSRHSGYKVPKGAPEAQLYDMINDPKEQNNLFEQKPDVVKELKKTLDAYINSPSNTLRE